MVDPGQNDQSRGVPRHEKEEKGQEKQEEKGQGLDEKYRRDPVGFVAFALLIIWLGVFLLLQNQNILADDNKGWAIFAWGAAGIFLVAILVRLAAPRWRQPLGGAFVPTVIAVGVGFGLWTDDWAIIGPIVLIAVGIAIVVGRLVPRR
jgi:hypothetical protein